MKSTFFAGLIVAIFTGAISSVSFQDDAAKTAQEAKPDIGIQDKKLMAMQTELKKYKEINKQLVKRLMRVVHREPDSPLVVFSNLIKEEKPELDWALLEAKAKLVEAMAISLQTPFSKGANYLAIATKLRESTKAKDYLVFKENVKLLQSSCNSCHGWSPPL